MIVKSINKVKLEDGTYQGIWKGLYVTVEGQEFKVGRASKGEVGCQIIVENGVASVNSSGRGLTKEEAEGVLSEIEEKGLGYWASNDGFTDDMADPKLVALCNNVKKSMDELESHLINVFNQHGINMEEEEG